MSNYNLTPDQRRMIDMYVSQYNQTNSHIERLLDMLDEIRGNIHNIILSNQPRTNRASRNARYNNSYVNRYINNLLANDRPMFRPVYYDYNTPIHPSTYVNNTNTNTTNTNSFFRSNELSNFLNNFLNSSVVVRPTNEQINAASRVIRYGNIENPLSETCPISLERFDDNDIVRQIIPCGHIFCQTQFLEWFESNVRCPVCRYDIRNYRASSRDNETTPTSPTSPTNPVNQIGLTDDEHTSPSPNPNPNTSPSPNPNLPNTDNAFSNINVIRNPETNEIDQLGFDITNTDFANDLLSNITSRLFQSLLNPQSNNAANNDRIVLDPSNNIFLYEAIIRPNNSSNSSTNRNRFY